jgi:hypothetical protein
MHHVYRTQPIILGFVCGTPTYVQDVPTLAYLWYLCKYVVAAGTNEYRLGVARPFLMLKALFLTLP